VILSGVQSGDKAFGATDVALAEELGFEWAAVVNKLDIEREKGVASVHRELEGSVEELTDVQLPAVLTIQTGINDPRYASLRGIRQSQSKPLDVKTPADVRVEKVESSLSLSALAVPEVESDATLFEGSAEETTDDLADLLRDKGVEA